MIWLHHTHSTEATENLYMKLVLYSNKTAARNFNGWLLLMIQIFEFLECIRILGSMTFSWLNPAQFRWISAISHLVGQMLRTSTVNVGSPPRPGSWLWEIWISPTEQFPVNEEYELWDSKYTNSKGVILPI